MFSKITTAAFFVANVFLFTMLVGLTWRYGTVTEGAGYAGLGRWVGTIFGDKVVEAPAFSALDLVTTILAALGVLLTALGIFIAMLAIWGYQNLREHAKEAAEKKATEVAVSVAVEAARQTAFEMYQAGMQQPGEDYAEAAARDDNGDQ